MTSPIDPVRKPAFPRRSRTIPADSAGGAPAVEDRSLPVVIEAAPASQDIDAQAAFAAHLIGQDGQRRGLRGGPETLGAAKTAYAKIEWSGPADRRARKGGVAKTEV